MYLKEEKRNDDDYIRKKLNARLREEFEYIEEKRKSDIEAKEVLGDDIANKIACANDARHEALISGLFQ